MRLEKKSKIFRFLFIYELSSRHKCAKVLRTKQEQKGRKMIGLVDCDNFFVSCERVLKPALNGKPVLVLSNNDGCVVSRSNEAKALGIPMGIPAFKIKDLIAKEGVFVFSAHFDLYEETSARVMNILKNNAPRIEIYSIDEAFLDLSGMSYLKEYGLHLAQTVLYEAKVPVSIGIAPTKTLAKIASHFAKKYKRYQRVCVIDTPEKRIKALQLTSIDDVWGIGRRLSMRLKEKGVQTAYDFTQLSRRWVRQSMTVTGERIWRELNGEACHEFEAQIPDKQQISSSRSFEQMVTDLETLCRAVAKHADTCARKLRAQHSCVASMLVYVRTNRFRDDLPQCWKQGTVTFPVATSDTLDIVDGAVEAVKKIYEEGYHYKKAGVMMTQIVHESSVQTDLFDKKDWQKSQKLMQAVDAINAKYNRTAVLPAVECRLKN